MRYNITVNQVKALEWELSHSQALTFTLMVSLSSWASGIDIDGEIYYYCSAGLLAKEVPFISKSKSTFLGIIKVYKEKGLVDWKLINNRSYYKLSAK